jgi:hypothetical protein
LAVAIGLTVAIGRTVGIARCVAAGGVLVAAVAEIRALLVAAAAGQPSMTTPTDNANATARGPIRDFVRFRRKPTPHLMSRRVRYVSLR